MKRASLIGRRAWQAAKCAVWGLLAFGCSSSKKTPPTCDGPAVTYGKVAWPQVPCDLCPAYGKPYVSGPLVPDELSELSGIVASRAQDGVLFAHNDSGNAPEVFVLAASGKELGTLCPLGSTNDDWEDIGIGPCPSGSCIYVGDIGDNDAKRSTYGVYRIAEPLVSAGASISGSVDAEYFPFTYDDGPHNAEALFVHPESGRVYVIIKQEGVATVFEIPITTSGMGAAPVTAIRVGEIPIKSSERVTGADISPCGNALLVRTTQGLLELRSPDAAPASVDALLLANPKDVPVAMEPQGEAVSYVASGRGYVTGSERAHGPQVPLQSVDCQ